MATATTLEHPERGAPPEPWQSQQHADPTDARRWRVAATAALACMFLLHLSVLTFIDPDVFHEMALFREALSLGRLPLEDRFAYTPTVYPSVQHEWGTGAVLYFTTHYTGAAGLMALKYLLTFGCGALAVACARKRWASWETIALLAPLCILCGVIGFTTLRAQLFTLLFLALLLYLFEQDRQGGRRWLLVWLPGYVLWLNLHAGFVVGLIFFGLYTLEQMCRRQPAGHLILAGIAMVALVAVNPYGWLYYEYLAHGLTMQRPLITEWWPLYQTEPGMFRVFLITLLPVLYAMAKIGPRRMAGLAILLITAYAAVRHTRHLSLYLLVWLCYVPGYLQQTSLGAVLTETIARRARLATVAAALVAVFCLARALPAEPWRLRVPNQASDNDLGLPVYPVAAVDHLQRLQFSGNVMVPFVPGAYVSWRLHPSVKVSIDGRYEVAYQPGVLEENFALYDAQAGWRESLARHATDLVLVPRWSPLAQALPEHNDWRRVYGDDAYELYARTDLQLPEADEGKTPSPLFP